MEKILAIKGHPTRGKEVIELLEMMGGYVDDLLDNGTDEKYAYLIVKDENNVIDAFPIDKKDEFDFDAQIFTLEEFLEKYPYKIGDKIPDVWGNPCTVKSMSWDENYKTVMYGFKETVFVARGDEMHLTNVVNNAGLKIEKNMGTNIEFDLTKYSYEIKDGKLVVSEKTHKYPDNYEERERTHEDAIFDSIIWHLRNSVNNGKKNLSGGECEEYFREVVKKNNENKMKNVLAELLEHIKTTPKEELEREFEEIKEWSNIGPTVEEFKAFCECVNKKPVYPKLTNLTECKEILGEKDIYQSVSGYRGELLTNFQRLLIFRNAYWKIAGEEMGLGKSWEPDWKNGEQKKYCIYYSGGDIQKGTWSQHNSILAFPTEEMRDVFYENFKDLIEECKELL